MRLLFAVYIIANVLSLFSVFIDDRQQSCTANPCGEMSKAIKTLQTKVNNLIALVKDALPPKPPARPFSSCKEQYDKGRTGLGRGGDNDDSNTCGNEAAYSPDNGKKHIKAMGYMLVQ
ncbi:hypothetical protein AWC38_SpisGene21631 [Stylophora pistillata]|uniref:Uncharacterized protein n=1 Tax=Stylophora pistillata TaxID=50429 RepID=A0A2B4RAR8_STYPI|nr:hypothetical protein AWC38_SpisGene21631 [Stylophora pistillata]